jgi:hypothetical protein
MRLGLLAGALLVAVACGQTAEESAELPEVAVIRHSLTETCSQRNETLLRSLKAPDGGRFCLHDEECPQGAFCNESTGVCDWQCLAGGVGLEGCSTGKTCDCYGRCATPSDAGTQVENRVYLPSLEADPGYLQFEVPADGGTWREQAVGVTVRFAPDAGLPGWLSDAGVDVRVVAGRGMRVACPLEDGGVGTQFDADCHLLFGTADFGTAARATKTVQVVPFEATDAGTWEVQMVSTDTAPSRVLVAAEPSSSSTSSAEVREFRGHVLLGLGVSDVSTTTGETEPTVRLPVRAWANDTYLVLYDETRTLSPSGKVLLTTDVTKKTYASDWLQAAGGTGGLSVIMDGTPLAVGATQGLSLSGGFGIALPGPTSGAPGQQHWLQASYTLSRLSGATTATSCASGCAEGFVCESRLQVCLPGTQALTQGTGTTPSNTLISSLRNAWDNATAQQKLQDGLSHYKPSSATAPLAPWQLAEGILCSQAAATETQFTLSRFAPYFTAAQRENNVLPASGDVRCENGKPPYAADFFTHWDRYADIGGLPNPERLRMAEFLEECLADVTRVPGAERSDVSGWFSDRFLRKYSTSTARVTERLTPGRCFNLPRFFGAMRLGAIQATSKDQRMSSRLLQQWIGVNGFIAQQLVQQREAAEFLDEDLSAHPNWDNLENALGRFEKAWDVLLDSEYRKLLPGNDEKRTCAHLNPDYRRALIPRASWKRESTGVVQTRGAGLPYNQGHVTFVYASGANRGAQPSSVYQACNTPGTIPLFEVDYGPAGITQQARTFSGQCSAPSGVPQATVTHAAYSPVTATGGTKLSYWYPSLSSGNDLTVGLVNTAGALSLYQTARLSPQSETTSSISHPLLRVGAVNVQGQTGSTLAAWDYALDDAMLAAVAQNPNASMGDAAQDFVALDGKPQHDQGVGLPAIVVEGLAAHMRLLVAQLDKAEGQVLSQCGAGHNPAREQMAALFGRTLRYVTTLEAFAAAARERDGNIAACGRDAKDLHWNARWEAAVAELAVVKKAAYARFAQVSECRPFGVAANQAPLFPSMGNPMDDVERYFANSTHLYGVADAQVRDAISAADKARTAWLNARESQVREEQSLEAKRLRISDLKKQYGTQVIEFCGLGSGYTSETVLGEFANNRLSVSSCYVKPQCKPTSQMLYNAAETHQMRYTLCTWAKAKQAGASIPFFESPADAALLAGYATVGISKQVGTDTSGNPEYLVVLTGGSGTSKAFGLAGLYGTPFSNDALAPDALAKAHESCQRELGGRWLMPSPITLTQECYQGRMGEAKLALDAAVKNVEIARSSWGEFQERFDIANEGCNALASTNAKRQSLSDHHKTRMMKLTTDKAVADRWASAMRTTADTLGAAAQAFDIKNAVLSFGVKNGMAAAQAAATVAAGVAQDRSIRAGEKMQKQELEYQHAINTLEGESTVQQCWIQAKQHLVGMRTAALGVDRAMMEAQLALTSLENLETRVSQLVSEGQTVVRQEEATDVPGFSHHFWVAESISAARRSFEQARMFAYLFGRAFDYDKQQSSVALGAIFNARGPQALADALNAYKYDVLIDKSVGGQAPEGSPFVLKLREDILQLGASSSTATGERTLTGPARFVRRLLSNRGAVYDSSGQYIGQGFRFSLPVVAGENKCAERLWEVHVQLAGGSRLRTWLTTNGRAELRLRQRNTFASRVCEDMTQWQTAFIRPSWRPDGSSNWPWPRPGEEMGFTETLVQAAYGTDLLSFQTNGDPTFGSVKLKGRGLYSEYEIVFPWAPLLSQNNQPTDFPLDDVTDVWVRFDPVYVVPAR